MLYYQASVYSSTFGLQSNLYARLTDREKVFYSSLENVLESYHYIHSGVRIQAIRNDKRKIFLDSGAFSAFNSGAKIDIDRYCEYIHNNQDIIRHASVLDVMGDPDATWRNQMQMERRGTKPLPCYHYGESFEVLKWYMANYEYITIGGMVPVENRQLERWLNILWGDYLTNEDGTPKLKVHGFGLTSFELAVKYPWHSVDSSTWQAAGSMGTITLPRKFQGNLTLSNDSPKRKSVNMHLDTLPDVQRRAIIAEIEDLGGDVERLQQHYVARWAWNLWAMPQRMKNRGHAETFINSEQRLF